MGCGHSKINIYPKRARNKNCSKRSVTPEKCEVQQEVLTDAEAECSIEKLDDGDRKTIKVKPVGGPLLAHTELSSSQNNFFKMLDEKIESGPDYDSSSEAERALERARLTSLLKDWETASAGSRSLPATPKRRPLRDKVRPPLEPQSQPPFGEQRIYNPHSPYGSPTHQALQYQALSPLYNNSSNYQVRQYTVYGSPVRNYNSPKHIPYEQQQQYSPNHKVYAPIPKNRFSNGDLIQQQIYQQQLQYQQAREYQQYKANREQQLLKQQQQSYSGARNYQSSVHIPIVMPAQNDLPRREQYELT